MKFKNRLVRDKEGGVEIRLTLTFTKDEVESLDRIPDDPNVSFSILRQGEGDTYQKSEWYFTWLRILTYWVNIWNHRETMGDFIIRSVKYRKEVLKRPTRKRRRR